MTPLPEVLEPVSDDGRARERLSGPDLTESSVIVLPSIAPPADDLGESVLSSRPPDDQENRTQWVVANNEGRPLYLSGLKRASWIFKP